MNITPGSNIGVGNKRITGKEGRGRERINNMYVRVCAGASKGVRDRDFPPKTKKTIASRAQSLYRASSELNPKLFAGKGNTEIPP